MKKITFTAIQLQFLIFSFYIFSCTSVYIPNSRNIPSVNKVKEGQLTGLAGTHGFDLNVIYNIHDHIGIMANGSFAKNTRNEDNTTGSPAFHEHYFGEAGVGYFFAIDNDRTTAALYTGAGRGYAYSIDQNFKGDSIFQTGNYHRFFIQPSIVLDLSYLQLGFGYRFSHVRFINFETESGLADQEVNRWFTEPALELSAKAGNCDFVIQCGITYPMGKDPVMFNYRIFYGSVGIRYNVFNKEQ